MPKESSKWPATYKRMSSKCMFPLMVSFNTRYRILPAVTWHFTEPTNCRWLTPYYCMLVQLLKPPTLYFTMPLWFGWLAKVSAHPRPQHPPSLCRLTAAALARRPRSPPARWAHPPATRSWCAGPATRRNDDLSESSNGLKMVTACWTRPRATRSWCAGPAAHRNCFIFIVKHLSMEPILPW